MEQKKQTRKWSYSPLGKGFRGFLCMVTFIVFCVSALFTIYVMGYYEFDILVDPKPKSNYYETDMYQTNLHCEMTEVLSYLQTVEEESKSQGKLTILNMSDQAVHYYDEKMIGEMSEYDVDFGNVITDLDTAEVGKPVKVQGKNLYDFDELKAYLESQENAIDYVYFDSDAFKTMFEQDGLVNTDYRFSDAFSEESYFVFENYEIKKTSDKQETVESENTIEEQEAVELENTTEKQVATELEHTTEESVSAKEETVTEKQNLIEEKEEVIITPYNLTSYAVYDAEEGVYYSTGDNYFDEMSSYIYDVPDLLFQMKEIEKDKSYYNSIVIPVLRSYNYELYEILNNIFSTYAVVVSAENELYSCEKRGIYYYLGNDADVCYSNVENEQAIQEKEYYYRFEKNEEGKIIQTHSSNIGDAVELYSVREAFVTFSDATVLYFAFDDDNLLDEMNASNLILLGRTYNWIATHGYKIAILAVVSFVLLMIQAVWLLRTTGRCFQGDNEVKLNHFDRWYTEIWAMVVSGILVCSIAVGLMVLDEMWNYPSADTIIGYTIVGALPFGFFFMVLTLSFARRLKAHNIWNRLLVVRFVKYLICLAKGQHTQNTIGDEEQKHRQPSSIEQAFAKLWNRCKHAFYEIRGTKKLLVLFVFYICVGIAIVFAGMESQDGGCFILFCLLQILAVVIVLRVMKELDKLTDGVKEITEGNLDSKVEINEKVSVFGDLAHGINHIGDGLKQAVETSLKDERMKTELITNVSHDLKTPLTSIINYVDLLKKQDMPNEDSKHYIEVLDGKAQRLKQLTEDLVEAAKATSGNIELEMMPLTFDELMKQALGEFEDKYEKKNLTIVASYPKEPAVVMADGRRLFRIIENVLQNIYKYAMEGTRVYADLSKDAGVVTFTLKNVSAAPLNISPDELMERFTRGDSSRTTEGSGLGLSIAKDLTRLQNGEFEIQLDGDLFKVIIRFPEHK